MNGIEGCWTYRAGDWVTVVAELKAGLTMLRPDSGGDLVLENGSFEVVGNVVAVLPSRFSDLGAGGAKYDFLLFRSIIAIAQSCKSTGVLLAACRKLSLSCSSRGVGLSSGFLSRHFAQKSSNIAGNASLFGNFGAGS